jgi:hypothetical protein
MQFANTVAEAGEAKSEHSHAEIFDRIGWILTAERKKVGGADAETLDVWVEVAFDQAGIEVIVSGRNGSVGGENQARRGEGSGFGQGQMLRLHQADNAFEAEKGGMAFVHVLNGGLDADGFESAISSDAEENFLFQAHFEIAAVKLIGNLAVFGSVLGRVRVEQE